MMMELKKNKTVDIILFEETDTSYSNDDSVITEHDDGSITIAIKMPPCKDVKIYIIKHQNIIM